jgi:hypothetical protein
MVNFFDTSEINSDTYFQAASKWFQGEESLRKARSLIDGEIQENDLWESFQKFGLIEMMLTETNDVERAKIFGGVCRAAGRELYIGPVWIHPHLLKQPSEFDHPQADGTGQQWQSIIYFNKPLLGLSEKANLLELSNLQLLGNCARLIGVGEQVISLSTEYLKTRHQFGKSLASFQALQHATVNQYTDLVLAGSLLSQLVANWADVNLRVSALHALKVSSTSASINACDHSVQMLGAMGFTHDCDVGLYLRHALTLAARDGSIHAHRQKFTQCEVNFLTA